jgi:hypothetical protein
MNDEDVRKILDDTGSCDGPGATSREIKRLEIRLMNAVDAGRHQPKP